MHASQQTFFWHDYETTGTDKVRDRPTQFAGIRTTLDLEEVEEPVEAFCKLAADILPMPEAVLLTGITPQKCELDGICEADFARVVLDELGRAGTCGVGYNSLRFDDEMTRQLLYRNFHDPYAREWQNNNSRWDIIDVVRAFHILCHDGITWPVHEHGAPSFRLEDLATANGLIKERAHDAVSDVRTTIALARLLKERSPELFSHCFSLRSKHTVQGMIDIPCGTPLLHVATFYQDNLSCIMPLAVDPKMPNTLIALNLSVDPNEVSIADAALMAKTLFSYGEEIEEENAFVKLPLVRISINRSPMLFPLSMLNAKMHEKFGARAGEWRQHWHKARGIGGLGQRVKEALTLRPEPAPPADPELALYGEFPSVKDKKSCVEVTLKTPQELAKTPPEFEDKRWSELLFRYRARNWPETLSENEMAEWEAFRLARLHTKTVLTRMTVEEYGSHLDKLEQDPVYRDRVALLGSLREWASQMPVQPGRTSAAP
jgi:exodeoxyribonuclease-1